MNIVKISDGLGNQMFQYAFARKLQIDTGKKVYLDTRFINNEDMVTRRENDCRSKKNGHRKYGLNHFRISLQRADTTALRGWDYLTSSGAMTERVYDMAKLGLWPWQYCDEEVNVVNSKSVLPTYYKGYFFHLDYYDSIRTVLQREFRLKDKIKLPVALKKILHDENTVSIHVRRGDFLKLNRDISCKEYYPKALEYMKEKLDSPTYVICSDDIEWVKANIAIPGKKVYISDMGFADYEEMTIMKHCKHNIIANSTFSYWSAYLNSSSDKIVVCPKNWKTDIIPKEWVRM